MKRKSWTQKPNHWASYFLLTLYLIAHQFYILEWTYHGILNNSSLRSGINLIVSHLKSILQSLLSISALLNEQKLEEICINKRCTQKFHTELLPIKIHGSESESTSNKSSGITLHSGNICINKIKGSIISLKIYAILLYIRWDGKFHSSI